MSYTQLLYHIVISTHKREPVINIEHERELYGYMFGFMQKREVQLLKIGGMPDHIHILVNIPASLSVAGFVRDLKGASSKWLKANRNFPLFEGWAREYGAFSYSFRNKNFVARYIQNQKVHHQAVNFADEYRTILKDNDITIQEEYFLKD